MASVPNIVLLTFGVLLVVIATEGNKQHTQHGDKQNNDHHVVKKPIHHRRHIILQDMCLGGAAPLCCTDKNNTCRVYGPRMNNHNSKTCFCDSECLDLGDCCTDYAEACKPQDCELAEEWGPYSSCSVRCGWGFQVRKKNVLFPARNGGKDCGKSQERIPCYGITCKHKRGHDNLRLQLRETGSIIPATTANWRQNIKYNPFKDIRKNLYHHYSANDIIRRPPYCAQFEVTHSRKSCQSTFFGDWAPQLKKGATVCVECQQFAMKKSLGVRCRGHGVLDRETRWNAMMVPGCHGKWTMKSEHKECSCPKGKSIALVLL